MLPGAWRYKRPGSSGAAWPAPRTAAGASGSPAADTSVHGQNQSHNCGSEKNGNQDEYYNDIYRHLTKFRTTKLESHSTKLLRENLENIAGRC